VRTELFRDRGAAAELQLCTTTAERLETRFDANTLFLSATKYFFPFGFLCNFVRIIFVLFMLF